MDLRDLRSFVAVTRTGSFTAAARELGYTQSAVSQHIANLEASVGRALLLRRPVRTTAAGARLAEHAAHVVLRLDVAQSELALSDDELGRVRVAMTPLAAVVRVAEALRRARVASPSIGIELTTMSAADAVVGVAEGRADVAVVDGLVAPGNPLASADAGLLASFAVDEEPVVVVVPNDHPLRRERVDLAALADARWIHAPRLTPAPLASFGRPGSDADRVPQIDAGGRTRPASACSYDGTDVATLLALVAAGHGLTMLPLRAATGPATGVGIDADSPVRTLRVARPPLVHRTELLVLKNAVARFDLLVDALRMPR